jgi:hypothetical protein
MTPRTLINEVKAASNTPQAKRRERHQWLCHELALAYGRESRASAAIAKLIRSDEAGIAAGIDALRAERNLASAEIVRITREIDNLWAGTPTNDLFTRREP